MNREYLGVYKQMLPEIFASVSAAIGIHVMLIVLERSVWKTKIKYPEASLIKFSQEGITLDSLDTIDPDSAVLILDEFLLSIIDTLGRLVGIQVAEKLTDKLRTDTGIGGVE